MASGPAEPVAEDDLSDAVQRGMLRTMSAARWIMAPVYVGLMVALVLDVIKFWQKLVVAAPEILRMDTSETILTVLTLIDLSLVGNLIVIVVFAGVESFGGVPRAGSRKYALSGLDFSGVKQKLIGSIAAIASIQILETFVHIENVSKADAMWQLAILLGIGVTGILLAGVDRLAAH